MTRRKKSPAFSLVEIVTSVVIIGILVTVFYSVFLSNWSAMDQYSTRAYLWQEMDAIVDRISDDGRAAARIDVSADQKTAAFFDGSSAVFAVHNMTPDGDFIITRGEEVQRLSDHVNYELSSFEKKGESILIHMALSEQIFTQDITIHGSTEIYPRN